MLVKDANRQVQKLCLRGKIYRNQKYVVYTYFKDTNKLIITTNINDTANDVVNKTKEGIDSDARVVKEILYYQQNLKREHGLRNWIST